jgi:D-alanine transaminase
VAREIYLNGRIVPFEEASISPDERALQFSESVYEVVRAYGGRSLEMGRHMRRLIASAEYLGIDLRPDVEEIAAQCEELLRRSGLAEALIYIQVTTGATPRAHLRPDGLSPTILATVSATPPTPERWVRQGMTAITVPDERWARCHVKTTMLLVNTTAKKRAVELGQDDAIFIRDGFVTEATAGNIFAVFGDLLVTPPKSNYILHGITRELLIEIARETGIPCEEGPLPQAALYRADELILTGTAFEALAIVAVDGKPVGTGRPGSMTARLSESFRQRATRG